MRDRAEHRQRLQALATGALHQRQGKLGDAGVIAKLVLTGVALEVAVDVPAREVPVFVIPSAGRRQNPNLPPSDCRRAMRSAKR
jgi:hypothetical protein